MDYAAVFCIKGNFRQHGLQSVLNNLMFGIFRSLDKDADI